MGRRKGSKNIAKSNVVNATLNWRDFSKETPKTNGECSYECLLVTQYISDNKLQTYVTTSFFHANSNGDFAGWSNLNNNEIVLLWLPVGEVLFPKKKVILTVSL